MSRRTAIQLTSAAAALCCVAACTPDIGSGILGSPNTAAPITVSPNRSVAVSFTAARSGWLSAVALLASRYQRQSVGMLAYLITANDPNGGGHPAAPTSSAGAEPGCWGAVMNPALASGARALRVNGYACHVQAGHTYWIQFNTVAGAMNLYPSRSAFAQTVATRSSSTASWARSQQPGGLDVAAIIHPG